MGICRLPWQIVVPKSYDPVFANNSWEQIIAACQDNNVPDTWVADGSCYKDMDIGVNTYQIDVIGKNHDTYAAGGIAPLTFQVHDCYYGTYGMNTKNINDGGWASCFMRQERLPSIFTLLPPEVQNGIQEINKLTSAGSKSSTINTTADKLFLLSEIEIFGNVSDSVAGEGSQYAYYSAGNSKVKNRSGSADSWWERSPRGSDTTSFCCVYKNGGDGYGGASLSLSVPFAFCF